jgi:hypothetical protein
MVMESASRGGSIVQASNGRVDPRLAALTPEDQRLVWTLATLMIDATDAFGETVARFQTDKLDALPNDDAMVKALAEHASADAKEVLVTLRAGMDPRAHETPVEAISHARMLRARGVGVNTLIQVYKLGFAIFRDMLALELNAHSDDPAQIARVTAGADAYSFPFIGTVTKRLTYEFGAHDQAWTPTTDDPALADKECLEVARRMRDDRMARGLWVAATPDASSARPDAEQALHSFTSMLEAGVRDKGLHDRLALAATTITITLADEPDLSATLLLDRSPVEFVDGVADAECQIWIASVDLERVWSPDFYLPMAIAKGRVRITGPVRKFLRIVPILRAAGEAQAAVAPPENH